MTNEKALEIIGNAKPSDAEMLSALCSAAVALEKQIPKRAGSGKFTGQCACGKFVFVDQNFCPKCGQRLDWSD